MAKDTQTPDMNLPRKFVYNGAELEDPDPAMSEKDVKTYYAQVYPELTTANPVTEIKGTGDNRYREISFKKATGTKG
jgi:PRTRC genetic system protein C